MSGHATVTTLSVLLNASYYEKHRYVWFMGEDLNNFGDIKPFMNHSVRGAA